MSIVQFIDHTILKPVTALGDIERICEEAKEYGFAAVCIPPYYVSDARQVLGDSKVHLATVIGFPFGYNHYRSKAEEAKIALGEGAGEIDMVFNLAAFKNNDMAWLETEIGEISKIVTQEGGVLKLIIESGILTEEEIRRCCELYRHYPIHYLKTSTGYAEKGASIEAVKTMRAHLPSHIQIKASGGIRTYEFAKELVLAGATRLGCSASVEIAREERAVTHH
jgi:deoxyribose-phosphate aldolase